jgi:hypothetical protein
MINNSYPPNAVILYSPRALLSLLYITWALLTLRCKKSCCNDTHRLYVTVCRPTIIVPVALTRITLQLSKHLFIVTLLLCAGSIGNRMWLIWRQNRSKDFGFGVDRPIFHSITLKAGKPVSSVSIVSDYDLDDRTIEVRSPSEIKGFFL